MFYVPTIVLQDENGDKDITKMIKIAGKRAGFCDDMTSDGNGSIYFGILDKGCVSKHSLPEEQITQVDFMCNPDKFVWINSLFWNDGYLYIMTNE